MAQTNADRSAYQRDYYQKNRDHYLQWAAKKRRTPQHKAKMKKYNAEYRSRRKADPAFRAQQLLMNARGRNKHKVTISRSAVTAKLAAGVCEATGLKLNLNATPYHPLSPSLDRTNNKLGYTPKNTRVVAYCYNSAKGVGTHADVVRLAEAVLCTPKKKSKKQG